MSDETKGMGCILGGVIGVVILFIALATSLARVDAGDICITTSGGAVQDVAEAGWNLKAPWKSFKCYEGRTIVFESVADLENNDSTAQYITPLIEGKTVDGLGYTISFSMAYNITADEAGIQNMYRRGARDTDRVNELLVKYIVRQQIPQIANTYTADALYLGNLAPISKEILDVIQPYLAEYGITVNSFGLKKPDFVDSYEQAIADKALKVEEIKREELAQQLQTEQAETLRIKTEGEQAAAILTSEREAETAIIAANAEAERLRVNSQAEADSAIIAAQAEAERITLNAEARAASNELIGTSLAAHPELLTQMQIQAISDANVIYLPAEGVLPIMDVTSTPEAENE